MFGDYTVQQAAIVFDMCDETVAETVKTRSIPTRRKFLLFGPVLLDKSFVDSIAPDVRALMQRIGGTRKDWERKKQDREQAEQETKQIQDDIQRINEERRKNEEGFVKQWNGIMEEHAKKILSKIELDQSKH